MRSRKAVFLIHTIILVLSFSILLSAAYSQSPEDGTPSKITDIKIEGNKIVSTNTILSKIKIRVGSRFSQKGVNEDIKRLYATGFFTDVTAEAEDYQDGIRLIFSVSEKSVVSEVIFEGNKIYKTPKLKKEIETKEGDVLNRRRLNADVKKIKAFYKKQGFPLVDVSFDTDVDESTNKAKVYIKINEKGRYRIKKITFEGNETFTDKRLMKIIATRRDALFTSGVLDEQTLKQDMERLKAFYGDEGFIDAKAESTVKYIDEKPGIDITIKISEGPRYFVGKIKIEGNKVINTKKLSKGLRMKTGDPYSPNNLRFDVMNIQTTYFDAGYMSCSVRPSTELNQSKKAISVTYHIAEGPLSYVNEVRITGNVKTKDFVIRRELRLYPGEKFDGAKLRKSKQKLYDLGYFDEVIFDTEPTEGPDKKDLVVTVKEAKTGEFSFGGGYSSVDRLVGFVEVSQRNFDITNFKTFTGAGQTLKLRAEIGYVRQNYVISFTEPWIFGYPYLFGFDLFNYDRDKKESLGYGYSERKTGGNLRLGKEFTDYDRADLVYRFERVRIKDVSDDASYALKREEGKNNISSMALTLTRDTTDSKYSPTSGYLITGTGEDAGGIFGGDKNFYKLSGLGTFFFNYNKKLVLELKVRGGWEDEYGSTDFVPIYERFFAGGANTVRGYKERSIGPRDSKTGDPIGGEAMAIGNAELTYPVFKNFKVAVFYDVGNVWENSEDLENIDAKDFKAGTGVGIRVKTPIGPVKVDLGFPLDTAHPGDKKKPRFHFNMTRGF